ncbi:trypsin-like peptidase domain-containing protein [Solwaraspora sp. WMMD791]|uniref:S1C family serine protease n=1 Tax=Solwaraspora sp. WMMD791 TaxID=3016086 RepID=UPI00249AD8EA|nr:trypsin-like peptidase domain-containing protein [Solwaraspora sp. WMMD791]WFE26526.1 trypsin-like peptidase domain-containing protein [Solwaraspora sp. WMMD791]
MSPYGRVPSPWGMDWEAIVTDGGNWRRADGNTVPGHQPPVGGWPQPRPQPPSGSTASPWWSDALRDPWRDPYAPSAVVVEVPPVGAGAAGGPEVVSNPDATARRGLTPLVLVSVITALLAGSLGGALGFAFAVRGGAATGGTALGAGPGNPPGLAQRPADSFAGVAQRVLPSVVTVQVSSAAGQSVGSGFVATADGYVITNDHVVGVGAREAMVLFSDGSTAGASIVGQDPESDVAVIKVDRTGLTPVEFGDSDAIAVGDPVLAFGSPLALTNTVTSGIVSAIDRTIRAGEPGGQQRYYAAIQTDAAVNQGNSGGPLVDGAGRVIGVNSVIKSLAADEETAGNIGLAFAIPINHAQRITLDIINTGKARRTVFGANVTDAAGTPGAGVRLSDVVDGGPAAAAGLQAGDVVLRIDGRPLDQATDLIALVRKYPPGAVVAVDYRRGTENRSASVTLAADAK